jgi:hemerythrin-like domain-containing protein
MIAPNEFVMHGSFFAHRALMRDTEMLNSIAGRIDLLDRTGLKQLKKWYDFYWNMMEQHHAAEDDFLFRALEEKLNEPSEDIEVMEVEHNRIQFLIDEVKRLVGELERDGKNDALALEFQSNATELLNVFRRHIEREEKYVREKMMNHFSPKEQQRIEQKVKRKAPYRYLSYMIPWLHDSLNQEENKMLDASLPRVAKVLNRFIWKEKYNRLVTPVKAMLSL